MEVKNRAWNENLSKRFSALDFGLDRAMAL